jgi:FAD/FMN-containing dehydrogenase
MAGISNHPSYRAFADTFSGTLLTPGDADYDEQRTLFNSMVDERPGLIAQCASADDVAAAIAFSRSAGLEIAVRAGGHSVAGMSTVADGIVIDVRPLKEVTIDPAAKTARVGAGVTWGEFDRAAQEHGLAVTGGRVSTTGVAGFTLGGGSGWIERKFGLACDNLISVDLVTAAGEQITASADSHSDLFWALHGAGANFGVATSFVFQLHELGPIVHAGLLLWPAASAEEVARAYRDIEAGAPEELGSGLVFLTGPPEDFVPEHLQGQPAFAVAWCYYGAIEDGEALVAPLRALGPDVDLVGPMPYAEFQCMIDDPPGKRNYWSAEYVDELTDDVLAAFIKSSSDMPAGFSQNIIFPWGGAVGRVGEHDTPMSQRSGARYVFHPFAVWEGEEHDAAHVKWCKDALTTMREHATGGIYLNFIGDEGKDRVKAAYGEENYARLVKLKQQYDPDNIFHRNQNIAPA